MTIRRFAITGKAPTRAFFWLKALPSAFTFKTLLRHYAKQALNLRIAFISSSSESSTTAVVTISPLKLAWAGPRHRKYAGNAFPLFRCSLLCPGCCRQDQLKFYKEMFNDDLFTLMSYSCVENKGRVNV